MRSDLRSTPSRVGKYDLKAVIARTAQSVVYDGWDANIARRVAIKLIPLRQADDEDTQESLARFRRGAQAAGQLNHRNIVSVYDYGETEDTAYLVMEFIEGPTLKTLFDNNRKFTTTEIGSIVGGILDALQYSHDRKVVHRDMKPANVMFTADNTVKITDFGIARLEDSEMTQAGMVIGTPAYMSPEQFLGEKVDLRTDIYSTGVLLYHILTGERPYEGTLATIMHKVLYGAPLLPSRLSRTVTPALDSVVTRAMARKKEDRFQTAAQFKSELMAALSSTPLRPALITPTERTPLRTPPKRAVPWGTVFAGLAVVAVGAGAGVGWHLVSTPQPKRTSEAPAVPSPVVAPPPAAIPPPPAPAMVAPPPQVAVPEARPAPPAVVQSAPTPAPDTTPLFAPEARPPEPESPPVRNAEPVYPPPTETVPERKPPPKYTATVPERPAPKPPSVPPGTRPAARSAPPADTATEDALRRLRNGTTEVSPPPAPLVAPPTVYATASSSGAVGLFCQSVTTESAQEYGLDGAHGMVVLGVTSGSAAAKAGIQPQDVILKINGAEINDLSALPKVASNTPAGVSIPVEILRHRTRKTVQLQVDKLQR